MSQNLNEKFSDLEFEKKSAEVEKLKLEQVKINLENKDLKKSWYRKPQWWGFLFPTIISAIWLVSNGFFTNNFTLLNIREENLKFDIKNLNKAKDSIRISVTQKQSELDDTKSQLKA